MGRWGEGTVVVVGLVYVDVWVAFGSGSNGLELVPSPIKDGGRQVVHTSSIRSGLGLSTEDWGI